MTKTDLAPEQLERPSVLPKYEYGRLSKILFLAGNESRNNYELDVYTGQWLKHSSLRPEFAISE